MGGASPSEMVTNVLEKEPAPLTSLATDRSPALDRIVTRLLAKRADDRYQSAAELSVDLAAITKPPRLWERLFRPK